MRNSSPPLPCRRSCLHQDQHLLPPMVQKSMPARRQSSLHTDTLHWLFIQPSVTAPASHQSVYLRDLRLATAHALVTHAGGAVHLPTDSPTRYLQALIDELCSLSLRDRSEEHTSELQSPCNLVCRLLLEKKRRSLPNSGDRRPHHRYHLRSRSATSVPYDVSGLRVQVLCTNCARTISISSNSTFTRTSCP